VVYVCFHTAESNICAGAFVVFYLLLSVQVHIYHVDLNNLLLILQCVALFKINCRYAFRCHPTTKDGTAHLVSVNDIVFNPQ
jgi:hypothetical protein